MIDDVNEKSTDNELSVAFNETNIQVDCESEAGSEDAAQTSDPVERERNAVPNEDELSIVDYVAILKRKRWTRFLKRAFDITSSFIGLAVLSPILIVISSVIVFSSKGGVFFKQKRVGKNGKVFKIVKFRTMVQNAESKGMQITVGTDCRVTGIGKILRKIKLDELPQLFNVLIGQMSVVGPRPEVPKYVEMYSDKQRNVLLVRPGITELASIIYRDENEELAKSDNPEKTYVEKIMPRKLNYNLEYIKRLSFFYDIKLIFKTLSVLIK